MLILNLVLSVLGFVGWSWIWWCNRYVTGRTIRTQIGVILLGLMWVLLIIADTYQQLQPTGASITARVVLLFALWFLMPLLRDKSKSNKKDGG